MQFLTGARALSGALRLVVREDVAQETYRAYQERVLTGSSFGKLGKQHKHVPVKIKA